MEELKIKVSTDKLRTVFSDVSLKVAKVQDAFNQIDQIVVGSRAYWECTGQVSMKDNYDIRKDDYERIFKEFDNHLKKLQQIAGIYEETEKSVEEVANILPSDVIV